MRSRRVRTPEIRVSFVGRAGEKGREHIIPSKTVRIFDHKDWDRDLVIRKFAWYLGHNDQEGLTASYKALIRLNCLGEALRQCLRGARPNTHKTASLLSLWNTYGLHSMQKSLGDNLPIVIDAIKHFAPPFEGSGLTLYRGQSLSRYERGVIGVAWTGRLSVAQQFSTFRDTQGVVLEVDATPDIIAAYLPKFISTPKTNRASDDEFEDEYLIDPRGLGGRVRVHGKS